MLALQQDGACLERLVLLCPEDISHTSKPPDRQKTLARFGNKIAASQRVIFRQLSGREMEIRSAGPENRMWTSDDLVMK